MTDKKDLKEFKEYKSKDYSTADLRPYPVKSEEGSLDTGLAGQGFYVATAEHDLTGANFAGTDVQGLVFDGVSLKGTNFKGSNVTAEQLAGAIPGTKENIAQGAADVEEALFDNIKKMLAEVEKAKRKLTEPERKGILEFLIEKIVELSGESWDVGEAVTQPERVSLDNVIDADKKAEFAKLQEKKRLEELAKKMNVAKMLQEAAKHEVSKAQDEISKVSEIKISLGDKSKGEISR